MATPSDSRPSSKRRVGCSCDANRLHRHVIDAGVDRGAPCRMGMWCIVPLPGPQAVGRLGSRFKHHARAPRLPRSRRAPRLRRRPGCRRVATRSNGPTRWCARCRARAGWSRRSGRRRAHRIDCSVDPVGALQRPRQAVLRAPVPSTLERRSAVRSLRSTSTRTDQNAHTWLPVRDRSYRHVRSGDPTQIVQRLAAGQDVARPRNTTTDRASLAMSSSDSRPIRSPSLGRGTVVILSTMSRLGWRMPVVSSESTGMRNSGASVSSVVNAQTVTEVVASKRSSWMMTTGRGLPAYPLPAAAVQISPRFTRWRRVRR